MISISRKPAPTSGLGITVGAGAGVAVGAAWDANHPPGGDS